MMAGRCKMDQTPEFSVPHIVSDSWVLQSSPSWHLAEILSVPCLDATVDRSFGPNRGIRSRLEQSQVHSMQTFAGIVLCISKLAGDLSKSGH